MKINLNNLTFRPLTRSDGKELIAIFNHYIMHSDAAFLEEEVPEAFFDRILDLLGSYPSATVRDEQGSLVGFGMIRPYNPLPVFSHTGEVTYFLRPEYTGGGIGGALLKYLENEGFRMGLSVLLAQISSKNEGSIRFHHRNGFRECGRFVHAGKKRGEFFDTVWMQKMIQNKG